MLIGLKLSKKKILEDTTRVVCCRSGEAQLHYMKSNFSSTHQFTDSCTIYFLKASLVYERALHMPSFHVLVLF